MKTYLKTLARMFKKHVTRFISIIFIVIVAVGFISGIGSSTDKINYSLTDYYKTQNVSDLILKSKSDGGFSEDEINAVKALCGEVNVNTGMSVDVNVTVNGEECLTRLYFLDEFAAPTVNVLETLESKDLSEGEEFTPAYAEISDNKIKGIPLETVIELDFKDVLTQLVKQSEEDGGSAVDPNISANLDLLDKFVKGTKTNIKVTQTVKSPLTFANDGEPSYRNGSLEKAPDTIGEVNNLITLENILYLPSSIIPEIPGYIPQYGGRKLLPTGDMYVALDNRTAFDAFGKDYEGYVNSQQTEILKALGCNAEDIEFVTLYQNYSFVSLNSYADKVMGIGLVLMVAFVFVTALVAQSTMTRLMEEERAQIACLKTLGYSSFKIVFKYLLFAMIAAGIGGVASYFVGLGLAFLIYYVFNYSFSMPPVSSTVALPFFLIVFFVIVAITLLSTLIAGLKLTSAPPANLLRPKPPKVGKKVFLERIPLIWNRLSFKYKSTTRNVLRYFGRFIMTVVSVAVSTALVLAGLAILDVCLFGGLDSPSVMGIAVVVIIFAGLLTATVIYTLTNINVSERNRELATLKVLGYQDNEVAGYIYREVYIDTVVGIIFGYPLSAFIIWLVFSVIGIGTIGGVSWFWWLIAPAIVLLFAFIVTLMLKRKIVKIDMNESLKAIE